MTLLRIILTIVLVYGFFFGIEQIRFYLGNRSYHKGHWTEMPSVISLGILAFFISYLIWTV